MPQGKSVEVQGKIEISVSLSATAEVRTFLSRQLFKPAARHFMTEVTGISSVASNEQRLQTRMLAFASVVCSAAHIEAHINSVYIKASEGLAIGVSDLARKRLSELWARSDNGKHAFKGGKGVPDPLKRYRRAAFAIAGKPQASLGGHYGSARDLLYLRNSLLHYRVRWPSDLPADDSALFRRLEIAFSANPFYPAPQNAFWPKGILGPGCAEWAVAAGEELTKWFDALLK